MGCICNQKERRNVGEGRRPHSVCGPAGHLVSASSEQPWDSSPAKQRVSASCGGQTPLPRDGQSRPGSCKDPLQVSFHLAIIVLLIYCCRHGKFIIAPKRLRCFLVPFCYPLAYSCLDKCPLFPLLSILISYPWPYCDNGYFSSLQKGTKTSWRGAESSSSTTHCPGHTQEIY